MKEKIECVIVVLIVVISQALQAQDAQFYQAYASPLTLNPAMSGLIDGNYRLSGIYRDQWRSLVDKPFSTFSLTGDSRFALKSKERNSKDYVGVGIAFTSDKVGLISYSTNQLGLSAAFHKSLDQRLNQYLSFGIQAAVNQRNINYENLNFQDEFNGIDGYTDASGEILPANNFGFVDFSMGLHYRITPFKGFDVFAGGSLYHIGSPRITFFRNTSTTVGVFEINENLFRKIQVHGGFSLATASNWTIIPRAVYVKQGPHQQLMIGSNFKRELANQESSSFIIGGGIRMVNDLDALSVESAILSLGLDLSGKLIGFSYEFGVKGIQNGFRNQGIFELSFTYTGEYENDNFFCPKF